MRTAHTPPHRPRPRRRWLAPLLTPLLLALAGTAQAHDTWFAPQPPGPEGELVLALGTGDRFPRQETALDQALIQASGCQARGDGAGPTGPLQWLAYRDDAVLLRAETPASPNTRLSCWLQSRPLAITLDDRTVKLYLDEIRALPAVRARWAALQARGVRWHERYVKNARIELPAARAGAATAGLPGQAGGAPGLDLQADLPAGPLQAGASVRVRLLRDGQPLAGLPLALRNDRNPLTLWHRSDADGWITVTLPLAARWLITGVDLGPSTSDASSESAGDPDGWDSRFVSLHLETLPRR